MSPELVFDVTTLILRAHVRPTGIDRVQLETARVLAEEPSSRVQFCWYDASTRIYVRVDRPTVLESIEKMRGKGDPYGLDAGLDPGEDPSSLSNRLMEKLPPKVRSTFPNALSHSRKAGGHMRQGAREIIRTIRAAKFDVDTFRGRSLRDCYSKEWSTSTTYCSVGMDFSFNELHYLASQRGKMGFRTAMTVYDILPVVTPQYSTMELSGYFSDLVEVADVILVISQATARDLVEFSNSRDLGVPSLVQLPLGSALIDLAPVAPRVVKDMSIDFILTVSTVTIRKNHHLLLDVWEMLIDELGVTDVPRLVIAGRPGSLSAETMSRIERTPAFRDVVLHLADASDEELVWLYQNCRFSVYPSIYEGWGLPISESLDFGKVCLASDRSSLPEAGEGLARLLHPFDRMSWKAEIKSFWFDNSLREQSEREIVTKHRHTSARETAETILGLVKAPLPTDSCV